jgi:hypothetical protein
LFGLLVNEAVTGSTPLINALFKFRPLTFLRENLLWVLHVSLAGVPAAESLVVCTIIFLGAGPCITVCRILYCYTGSHSDQLDELPLFRKLFSETEREMGIMIRF